MNCQQYEAWIYTYREITPQQQAEVKKHTSSCTECAQLFQDVEIFMSTVKESAQGNALQSGSIAQKVSVKISGEQKRSYSLFDYAVTRYAMAAVSIGMLITFFMEVLTPELDFKSIKGPISNIQGAIINSDNLRKTLSESKSKPKTLSECKNFINNQVDINCVKEKLSKINL